MAEAKPWQPLLDWWFGTGSTATEVAAQYSGLWFGKNPCQDSDADSRFGGLVRQALDGGLEPWAKSPEGWLALIILLDQLPRMIFRDSPRAFAGDMRAQQLVRMGLESGWDRQLPPIRRVFVYLVLEHAEDLALQDLGVERHTELRSEADAAEHALFDDYLDFAERHRAIIARFGRFPHRNAVLGRTCSDEETEFLSRPGSRF